MSAPVAILRTRPETVVEDYGRLVRLVKYDQLLGRDRDLVLKLNLSWTKYFPACSTQPWQLDGILTALLADGFDRRRLLVVENKTVVTDPRAGCRNNRWEPVLARHGLGFIPLPEVEWPVHRFQAPLLRLDRIFPEGIQIPRMLIGRNVLHAPTVKCVHPSTRIVLADGSAVRAEALVQAIQAHARPVELPDGDRVSEGRVAVVSVSPEGRLGSAPATHFWRTPVADGEMWVVRTRTGRSVTTSSRHLFPTPRGWTPARGLRPGDRLAVPRRPGIPAAQPPAESPDLAWDRVEEVRREPADVPFFYDLSVPGSDCFVGDGFVLHNTHGHTVTTGAIKNAFGGLLKEVRHYAHEFIHEVMVDLLLMQRELHPAVFAVMDGTVMGDGAGPRTLVPRTGNLLLASADQVAIDAVAARIMGFDPLAIPYLRMCHERGLGVADPRRIELVGDADAAARGMGFASRRSLVVWGDQLIRRGPLRPLKRLLLHSPLVVWAPFASNVYHDLLWYPTVGRSRIAAFRATPWGRLFERY
jgi:hypothetical protein